MPTDPFSGSKPVAGQQIDRRDFIKATTAGAGLIALASCAPDADPAVPGIVPYGTVNALTGSRSDVVVVGAGLWGTFTAYNLARRGASVTLVDQYGPGNSRATSGDETRGVRSTYGEKGETGELWMLWAREAMKRWTALDEEWSRIYGTQLYFRTGDVTFRSSEGSGIIRQTREWWDKHGVPYEMVTPDEARRRWPVYAIDDIVEVMYEPDAGVVRSRKACQAMATVFERIGGRIEIGKATLGEVAGGQLQSVTVAGRALRADLFVFALGPWLRTFFPAVLGERMRTPIGVACYFGIPAGDSRFYYPNMPSYNFPGTTGWPALPIDSRGLRVRGGVGGRGGGGRAGGGGRGAGGGGRAGGAAAADPPPPELSPNNIPVGQDPDFSSRWADAGRIESARNFLALRIPDVATMPILETRSCHYEQSSSRDFIVDKHPEMANVWLAGGGNAEGAKFAPVIGDYISQRVVGIEGDAEVATRFVIPERTYETGASGFDD